jgi:hypothetical protein
MNYLTVVCSVHIVAHSLKRDIHGYGDLKLGRKPRERMKNNQPKSGRIRVSLALTTHAYGCSRRQCVTGNSRDQTTESVGVRTTHSTALGRARMYS